MTDTEPPKMTNVEQPKRDFKTVTNTKNRLVKAIKAYDDDELIIEYIQAHLPKAIDEYVSIVMEAAGLDEKIQENPNYQFLGKLDFQSMVTEDRIIDSKVKEMKIRSLIDEVQRSNVNLANKLDVFVKTGSTSTSSDSKLDGTISRVEKVKF